jgi:hypothetical protein
LDRCFATHGGKSKQDSGTDEAVLTYL